ncbi:MAG: DUF2804 domain-containing protein [Treponema sp.]|nr:DUF2804 domain-containing protein [Treponema sp.]
MYTREIQEARVSPVENGVLLQGTWASVFREVNLLDMRYPLPKWMQDARLKEWETFLIGDDRFFLAAMLFNVKLYRIARVFLYDREKQEKLLFWKVMPFAGRSFPRRLANDSIDSRSYGFFFRIHNWLDADTVRLDLDIEATRRRPSFTARAEFDLDSRRCTPMTVSLALPEWRGMYAFRALTWVRGDMVFGGKHISFDPAKTLGIVTDAKGFFPYRMRSVWCSAMGFDGEGRRFGFNIAENQTREPNKNNENALWVENELSPLPPVRITMPGGINSDWIIQDVEGMVDLVFTPQEQNRSKANLIVTSVDYEMPLGVYNGMLTTSLGKEIPVRGLWGAGERIYLRV